MSRVIYPPQPYKYVHNEIWVFLAGSIEMGKAEDWQNAFIERFSELPNIAFLNPRRPDWDSSWGEFHPELRKQIDWEQEGLELSDFVVFYFDPTTKSPVTLLELGICLQRCADRIVVCCPDGYWRKVNVVQTCKRYGIEVCNSLGELVGQLAAKLNESIDSYYGTDNER